MNPELIALLVGVTIMYAYTLFVAFSHIRHINKQNEKLFQQLSMASHSLAIYSTAKEGDFDTARIMAAVKREAEKTKPPVSAGAKQKQPEGVVFTEGVN
jgi:hypothetical protein